MSMQDNQVVNFIYTLRFHGEELIETSAGKDPATYLHGHGNVIPVVRKSHGREKQVGDEFEVNGGVLADAYGRSP